MAAIEDINKGQDIPVIPRQNKYMNNIVEQDHRRVKRRVRLMMGFKSFHSAQNTLAGIETVA